MIKNKNYGTIALIIGALLLFVGIIFYSWENADNPNVENSDKTDGNQVTQQPQKKIELGPNELAITAENFEQEVVKSDKLTVVDAYAPWCPHCQKIAPILTEISNEYVGKVKFGKMNADSQDPTQKANFDFAVKNGLKGYPTIWIYKGGQKVDTISGERTKEEFKTLIEKYL